MVRKSIQIEQSISSFSVKITSFDKKIGVIWLTCAAKRAFNIIRKLLKIVHLTSSVGVCHINVSSALVP
jgi:hypothetical protein